MTFILKKIFFLLIILTGLFTSASITIATTLEVKYPSVTVFGREISFNGASTIQDYVCYLFALFSGIAVSIAAITIALGGIYYLISYNRGSFTNEAKDMIKSGFLGALVAVCSVSIIYTINPNLTQCNLGPLSVLNFNSSDSSINIQNAKVVKYTEIPIGTLTENLLSRTMNCYGFDAYGDPRQGKWETDQECTKNDDCSSKEWCNSAGKCSKYFPTYIDHDRADCVTQIAEGVTKKAQTVALLSDELARLMDQCNCEGKCDPKCDPSADCKVSGRCGSGRCVGECVNGECEQPTGTTDCCPEGVKDQIEHGMIKLGLIIDVVNPDYVPSENMKEPDGTCFGWLGTIDPSLRNRTFYVAPELYDEALAAMQTWNNAFGVNLFGSLIIDESLSDYHPSNSNGRNEIYTSTSMDTLVPPTALAWNQNNRSTMSESDVGIGGNYPTGDATTNPAVYDIQSLMTHELGHSLGLKDLYTDNCEGAMMYGYSGVGQVKRELSQADINGIQQNYGITANPQEVEVETGTEVPEEGNGGENEEGETGGSTSGSDEATYSDKEYHGLDEFRCPNPIKHKDNPEEDTDYRSCDNIASYVEEQVEIDGKKYTIINKEKWDKLSLIQQMNYYKPEIEPIKKTITDDKAELTKASTALSQCYLAIPYIDLFKKNETTDKDYKVILTEKTYNDPVEKVRIDASKYCSGFNYNNSSCFKKCSDMCPYNTEEMIEDFGNCSEMSPEEATQCIKEYYLKRGCKYAPAVNDEDGAEILVDNKYGTNPKNFEECLSTCQDDCSTGCTERYLSDSGEYGFCQNQCTSNSQCIIDGSDQCLFKGQNIVDCTNGVFDPSDQGNIDYCINRAFLCNNGSDQHSGYQDCMNDSAYSGYSSASYIYANPDSAKCLKPYEKPTSTSDCRSSVSSTSTRSTICRELCPETQKCPTDSKCGECSCDKIDESIEFSIPNESNSSNVGKAGFSITTREIKEYQMVGTQCNDYSYNDDPLTFYCQTSPIWWEDPNKEGTDSKPIGDERLCPIQQEIPVGQTVDNAKVWADNVLSKADTLINSIQPVINQMLILGEAIKTNPVQDYCTCTARFENDTPICKTNCVYDFINGFDPIGGYWCVDWCNFEPCAGKPCEQMTRYITKLWNFFRALKISYVDFYTYMVKEPRSDIMKQLEYSRKTTDSCSVLSSEYEVNARMFSCTRMQDEIMPPINSSTTQLELGARKIKNYCYGGDLNTGSGKQYTDNWYCCKQYNIKTENVD